MLNSLSLVANDVQTAKLFTDINKSEPVRILDMPDTVAEQEKTILDGNRHVIVSMFLIFYSNTFSFICL